MPLEWLLAVRLLREGRAQTAVIVAGVGVGVGAIVFITALISGLQANLIAQTLGSQAHIVVRAPDEVVRPQRLDPPEGTTIVRTLERRPQRVRSIDRWQQAERRVAATPGIVAVVPVVVGPAFASRGAATRAVQVRGSELARLEPIIPISRRLVRGRASLEGDEALIGTGLAEALGLDVGDRVRLGLMSDDGDTVFTVRGVFDLGNKDVNERWVVVPLRAAQTLLDVVGGATALEATVAEVFEADAIASAIAAETGLAAESWMERNAQLLVGLRSQSSSSVMIQLFVILAVAMGIASVLIVSVVQRSREIGILRAMGVARGRVLRVFLIEGAVVGLLGAILGSALGAALALLFEGMALNPDGTPRFPVQLDVALFARTALIALATGLAAAALPARRAARLDPSTAIRHG